jgi:hypothetical protein
MHSTSTSSSLSPSFVNRQTPHLELAGHSKLRGLPLFLQIATAALLLLLLVSPQVAFAQLPPQADAPSPGAPASTPAPAASASGTATEQPAAPSEAAAPSAAPVAAPAPVAGPTSAQTPAARAETEAVSEAPPARSGFQMAVRTGYSLPLGQVSGDANSGQSDIFGGHVPIMVDLGGKVSDHVFVGGYLGLGFGGAGNKLEPICSRSDVTCIQVSLRIGAEIQYHFSPAERTNPWIGYGIGLESTGIGANSSTGNATTTVVGPEFARFMAGVDFRLSPGFGIGPYADITLGQYSNSATKNSIGVNQSSDITNTALHEWLTFGIRGVVFP